MSKQPVTPTEAERRRRLTQSEIIEYLLMRGGSDKSSVSITRNAKGGHQLEVTGRTADEEGMRTIGEVADTVAGLYDRLRLRYPIEGDDTPNAAAGEPDQQDEIRARAQRWIADTPNADDTPTQLARDVLALLHTQRVTQAAGDE